MATEKHPVCKTDAVPEGKGESFKVAGWRVAVFNVAGEFYAIEDRCSHADAPMADGYVHTRELCVACPWHGAEFDLKTGKALTPPACQDITAFATSVVGDEVMIEVEAAE
jgi:3-phenylpropionate/trans-cinnamate dioxygenase ferredoxin subunit